MGLENDLRATVGNIFSTQWSERTGRQVPSAENVQLGNHAVLVDGVILYADMSESTQLVDRNSNSFAAEMYKAYLHCAAKVIKSENGTIVSYDGDRIMAVFIGDSKNTQAANAALKINFTRVKIINEALESYYPHSAYRVQHTVGVDASQLYVARTGVRGSNDLVWVGRAANHAAKLGNLSNNYPSRVTKEVFDQMHKSAKYSSSGELMWEKANWNTTGRVIYRSTWWRRVT